MRIQNNPTLAALFPVGAPLLGGMLLLHTGACCGDFGMLAFLLRHPVRDFWTFDRSNEGKTWFYLLPADGRATQKA